MVAHAIVAIGASGGAGTDGAAGIVEIERLGGCVLVQDPRQASSPSMSKAALATDSPECLSIEDIAVRVTGFCLRFAKRPSRMDDGAPASMGRPALEGTPLST